MPGAMSENFQLVFARAKAQTTQYLFDVIDESLKKSAEERERRAERRREEAERAEARKREMESRLTAIESQESRAAQRTVANIAGEADEAARDVTEAQWRKRQLLGEIRRLDARA